ARLVRVEHRREGPHTERPQQRRPFPLLLPVGDRPLDAAGQRAEGVEVGPHLGQHPLRHEMRVHVDESGQAEPLPEAPHVRGLGGGGEVIAHTTHDHPAPHSGSTPPRSQNNPSCRPVLSFLLSSLTGTSNARPSPGTSSHPVSSRVSSTTAPPPSAGTRCRSGPAAATSSPHTAPPA